MPHFWHDIEIGPKAPEQFNCIIEIPCGGNNKYEIDKKTGLIALDRANYSSAPYPFDYGFIPQTLWEDGDALDVIVITTYPLHPGVLVKVRPVALLEMYDDGQSDFKIIGVPVKDLRWDDTLDVKDLNKHTLKEYAHFFETYKELKGAKHNVEIKGFKNKKAALTVIEKAIKMYKKEFGD